MLIVCAGTWLCWRNPWMMLPASLFLPFFIRSRQKQKKHRMWLQQQAEFKNVMDILYSSTAAGSTLPKAFRDAAGQMRLAPERFPVLLPEFERICGQLDRNVSMAAALTSFGERSVDGDIRDFARILTLSVRSGGDLPAIIKKTKDTIVMRMETNLEIDTMLAARKGELRIMTVVPPAIILYLNLTSPDYMDVLYSSLKGAVLMTAALGVYIAAVAAGRKILRVDEDGGML